MWTPIFTHHFCPCVNTTKQLCFKQFWSGRHEATRVLLEKGKMITTGCNIAITKLIQKDYHIFFSLTGISLVLFFYTCKRANKSFHVPFGWRFMGHLQSCHAPNAKGATVIISVLNLTGVATHWFLSSFPTLLEITTRYSLTKRDHFVTYKITFVVVRRGNQKI